MGIFSKLTSGGIMNEIRCDESSYLIWKWRPETGHTKRENAIRWGSSLHVKDGEVVVFVYSQSREIIQDFIEGPFDGILRTSNLPILADAVGLLYDGGTPFPAEIYFINLAGLIQTRFAVPYFEVPDPRFPDFSVPVAVRGSISFKIGDYQRFIKLHRLIEFNLDDFQKQIRDAVCRYVKDIVANLPMTENIPVVQLDRKAETISSRLETVVSQRLNDSFGVQVSGVDVGAVDIDKDSDGYNELVRVTKSVTAARVEAETLDYQERLRIAREEGQYAQRKQTQSANLAAFHVEAQRDVGVAGANALGQMGANGSGDTNFGGGGFNPVTMMTGMAVGSAVSQKLADAISHPMGATTPPPIPSARYYIAVNGQPAGSYDSQTICEMLRLGQLSPESLVWKEGMPDWVAIADVDIFKAHTGPTIPPLPSTHN